MDWIKCSEKLPDSNGVYLVVLEYNNSIIEIEMIEFASDMSKIEDLGCRIFEHDGPGWYDTYYNDYHEETEYYDLTDMVAYWMPLPALPAK